MSLLQSPKGYGFITPDEGGDDLFVHFSAVQTNGFKTLEENQKVVFDVVAGPKGKQAANIIRVLPIQAAILYCNSFA